MRFVARFGEWELRTGPKVSKFQLAFCQQPHSTNSQRDAGGMSTTSTVPLSPRSRRLSAVLPLTMQNEATSYDPGCSRPQSPSYFRTTVRELHSVLYGSLDKEEIRELIEEAYDGSASERSALSFVPATDGRRGSVREPVNDGEGPESNSRYLLSPRLDPRAAVVRTGRRRRSPDLRSVSPTLSSLSLSFQKSS